MNIKLIIAIIVIVALIFIFIGSYVLNKKTPLPKGCENLKINDDVCLACNRTECKIKETIMKDLNDEGKDK